MKSFLQQKQLNYCITPDHIKNNLYFISEKNDAYFIEPKTRTNIREDISLFETYLIRIERMEEFRRDLSMFEIYLKTPSIFYSFSEEFIQLLEGFCQKQKEYNIFQSLNALDRKKLFRLSYCLYKINPSLINGLNYGHVIQIPEQKWIVVPS